MKRKVLNFFVGCGVLFLLFNIGLYLYCYITPSPVINRAKGYYLYDSEGELIFDDSEDWIALEKISPHLINATVYTEDKNYYKHLGFDYLRIVKAVLNNKNNTQHHPKRLSIFLTLNILYTLHFN